MLVTITFTIDQEKIFLPVLEQNRNVPFKSYKASASEAFPSSPQARRTLIYSYRPVDPVGKPSFSGFLKDVLINLFRHISNAFKHLFLS